MMSLSMVVIAAMISAGGLGEVVLKGITQMKIGLGFEGGIAVVILAIVLDRITQGMAQGKKKKQVSHHRNIVSIHVCKSVLLYCNDTAIDIF